MFLDSPRESTRDAVPMRWLAGALLFVVSLFPGSGATCQGGGPTKPITNIGPVVRALCGKRVALLGESPVHGFGETLEFKAELVRRLVDTCHYNALFVESGTYDFIHIEKTLKSAQAVTDRMISSAIGGIWNNDEVQSLVPFLSEKVNAGKLILGGLDDQIGAGTYASRDMASDLVKDLEGGERSRCLGILKSRLSWQYTDRDPYSPSVKSRVLGCVNEIEGRLPQAKEGQESDSEGDRTMLESLSRDLARDFTEDDFGKGGQEMKWVNDRERSMYLNFKWLFSRLPKHSKVIVWAATVHLAKDLSGVEGFEGRVPLGSFIKRDFGDRAFSLGFSAYSGDYAFLHQPVRPLSLASASSLEGRVFARFDLDTAFLSRQQLEKYGSVAARPLGTDFKKARWDMVLDGLVIFRKEHAPAWLLRR